MHYQSKVFDRNNIYLNKGIATHIYYVTSNFVAVYLEKGTYILQRCRRAIFLLMILRAFHIFRKATQLQQSEHV